MSDGIVVVGGGPAGASAAIHLARAGHAVTILEREAGPAHRVCGEFLGGDALAELAGLGIDVAALGGTRIDRLRLVRGARVVQARLPFAAAGVSRRVLDAALLDAARRQGARVLSGHAVRGVRDGMVESERSGLLRADAVVLATGKHDMRGARRRLPHPPENLIGFKTHAVLSAAQASALSGAVELVLFRDSYLGLQMVDRRTANLCLLADASRVARVGGWPGLLDDLCAESPHLARRLDQAAFWDRPLAIARVPYGFLHRPAGDDAAGDDDRALFRVGDQMGVIASFTGDGMAIALHTGRLAAGALSAGRSARDHHMQARAALRRPLRVAGCLYAAGRIAPVQSAMMAMAGVFPGVLARLGRLTRVAA